VLAAAARPLGKIPKRYNLIRAIDGEPDSTVQLALLAALGKVATKDAVCVSFGRGAGARHLQAQDDCVSGRRGSGAGEAKTAEAFTALKALATDKDREVRETVARVTQYTPFARPPRRKSAGGEIGA